METLEKETAPTRVYEVSEDSKITLKVKDAFAIGAFLVYVGMSIAGYLFAKNKLESLEQGNQALQNKFDELHDTYQIQTIKLEYIEKTVTKINESQNRRSR